MGADLSGGQDRGASLPDPREIAASLRRIADTLDPSPPFSAALPASTEALARNWREPAAHEPPAATGGSPLMTRVLTALMDMPDVEFLAYANKVMNRYKAAVDALAPPGAAPYSAYPSEDSHA